MCAAICLCMAGLAGRLFFLMLYKADYYSQMAEELHQRERSIKAPRGRILDRNGTVIADNRTVCTISVIHNQVKDTEAVIRVLSEELGLPEAEVRKKTEKRSSREVIKSNVEKTRGDAIRAMRLEGVKVDEDYKRYYPYGRLASKVLGFTGGDNQGIIGLEVQYEKYLKGTDGKILTLTDAAGIELENEAEDRIEPEAGRDLQASLDVNIQMYAEQAAYQTMQKKNANRVSIIVMNPKNGEIYAMVNVRVSPFDANARRQTSFASLEVMPELDNTIQVDIRPEDIEMQVFRSSGAGGQHINKTSSAVRLIHKPTGVVVSCQTQRSQFQNRDYAMEMLKAKLYQIAKQQHMDKIDDIKGVQNEIAWGHQIRSYVFMPYTMVKDHRTNYETGNVDAVMDGDLDGFIFAYLKAASRGELQDT